MLHVSSFYRRASLSCIASLVIFVFVCANIAMAEESGNRYVANEAFGYGERLEYKVGIIGGVLSGLGGSGGLAISKSPKKIVNSNGETRSCYEVNF